jgi:hypothetical protein
MARLSPLLYLIIILIECNGKKPLFILKVARNMAVS